MLPQIYFSGLYNFISLHVQIFFCVYICIVNFWRHFRVLKQSQHKRKKFTYLYFHEGGTSIYLTYPCTSLFYDSFLRDSEGNSHGLPVVGIIFSLTLAVSSILAILPFAIGSRMQIKGVLEFPDLQNFLKMWFLFLLVY